MIKTILDFLLHRNSVGRNEFEQHKKAVVYKDTCEKTQDCIEREIKALREVFAEKMDGQKQLIIQKMESLESLIRSK